jgi:hypothetical protein
MPLYEVEIRGYVVADNHTEATLIAKSDMDLDGCDVEVYETHTVAAHWANLIPFGDQEGDEQTCMQILREDVSKGDDDS